MTEEEKSRLEDLLAMARALLSSMDRAISGLRQDTPWGYSSYKTYAQKYNALVDSTSKAISIPSGDLYAFDLSEMKGPGDTLAIHQEAIFYSVHGYLSMLCSLLDSRLGYSATTTEIRQLEDFVELRLRPSMLSSKPGSEREVQDNLERILVGRGMQKGIDYDRETGRVKYSGKESIPDFVFYSLSVALEVKLIKESTNLGRVIGEMNDDILSYRTKYRNILFVVYDTGFISDIEEFRRGIESTSGVRVLVVKH